MKNKNHKIQSIFFSDKRKKMIIFEATRKTKKHVLTAIPKPRARKTRVGKFEKAE
jgi:hypothetical protein